MESSDGKEKVRQAFAKRFRKALGELGYNVREQKRLHQLFGVSGQAVRKWAEGEALPTPSRLPILAARLGVRRAWLQDGEEPMRPLTGSVAEEAGSYRPAKSETTLTEAEFKMLCRYRLLASAERKLVHDLVSALVELPQ